MIHVYWPMAHIKFGLLLSKSWLKAWVESKIRTPTFKILAKSLSRVLLPRIKYFWYKLAEVLFSSYLIKIWLSVWHRHLVNLHILKTWIPLEWKKIFENDNQHFFYSYRKLVCILTWLRQERCDFCHGTTFKCLLAVGASRQSQSVFLWLVALQVSLHH